MQERPTCGRELLRRQSAERDQHSFSRRAEVRRPRLEEARTPDDDDVASELIAQILEEAPAVEAGQAGEIDQLRSPRSYSPRQRRVRSLAAPLEVSGNDPPTLGLLNERPSKVL